MARTEHHHRAYLIARSIKLIRQMGNDERARELCVSALEEGMPNALVGVAWEEGGK